MRAHVLFVLVLAGCSSFGENGEGTVPPPPDSGTPPADASTEVSAPADAAVDPELLLALDFEDGTNGVAKDTSNHGNDAALMGGAVLSPGRLGHGAALTLNGTSAYAKITNASISLTTQFTIAMWVRCRTLETLIDKAGAFKVWRNGLNPELDGSVGAGFKRFKLVNTFNPDEWHHLAFTYLNGVPTGYVDGMMIEPESILVAQRFAPGDLLASPAGDVIIGGRNALDAQFVTGAIDEVRIYRRALSDVEIVQLAK